MMNRIQFQNGLSLNAFLAAYGSEAQCEAAIEKARWADGFVCPACSGSLFCTLRRGWVKIFQCSACHRQTTLMGGTIFHSTKLSLATWFQALYFLTQTKTGISTLELSRRLGVSYRAAWRIRHKLMQAMAEAKQDTRLVDRIELDDAYLGGERTGGKRGRGSENKGPFVAAVETTAHRRPRRVVFSRVRSFGRRDMAAWANGALAPSAHVVSDGLGGFAGVTDAGCSHEVIHTGSGKKAAQNPVFRWVNTILGNVKMAFDGTFHGFAFDKYAPRYLAEVQYRFNRRYHLEGLLSQLVCTGAQTGPRPKVCLKRAEHWS